MYTHVFANIYKEMYHYWDEKIRQFKICQILNVKVLSFSVLPSILFCHEFLFSLWAMAVSVD